MHLPAGSLCCRRGRHIGHVTASYWVCPRRNTFYVNLQERGFMGNALLRGGDVLERPDGKMWVNRGGGSKIHKDRGHSMRESKKTTECSKRILYKLRVFNSQFLNLFVLYYQGICCWLQTSSLVLVSGILFTASIFEKARKHFYSNVSALLS